MATILIAEDESSFRKIYRDVLESQGYNVVEAIDGASAIELANNMHPALILLDIIMPKKDGFTVLKELRADPVTAKIPIILFSVLGEKADITKGLALGANDYALKGMTSPKEIIQKVRTLIVTPEAVIKERPAPNIYRLRIQATKGSATILLKEVGLTSFDCPKCGNVIDLEMQPTNFSQAEHQFTARLVCPVCKSVY